jgi:uncharacterized protein
MRISAILFFAALLLTPVLAQQPPAHPSAAPSHSTAASPQAADVPSKEQLMRLFELMEIQKQMGAMASAVGDNLEKLLPSSMGDITENQRTALTNLNTELYTKMMSPAFIESYLAELIPVYQHHFTRSEVNDLIAFYSTPVGKKFLREQPLLTRESLEKILPLMQKRVQETMVELDYEQRLRMIFSQQDQPPAEPKK